MKKILSLVLCFACVLSAGFGLGFGLKNDKINKPNSSEAAVLQPVNKTLWPKEKAVKPAGNGSETNPYQIATAENLVWMTYNHKVNDFYKQTNHIDLSKYYWRPVVDFSGNYDGDGWSIYGLYVSTDLSHDAGLFANVENSTIHGVIIRQGYISGSSTGGNIAGAICGYATNSNIYSCANFADIEVDFAMAGGIVGAVPLTQGEGTGTAIRFCYNYGNIIAEDQVGGIVGIVLNNIALYYNYNAGHIEGLNPTVDDSGNYSVGGIAGFFLGSSYLYNNLNFGEVIANQELGAGILGTFYGDRNINAEANYFDPNFSHSGQLEIGSEVIDVPNLQEQMQNIDYDTSDAVKVWGDGYTFNPVPEEFWVDELDYILCEGPLSSLFAPSLNNGFFAMAQEKSTSLIISFDANGGTGSMKSMYVEFSETASLNYNTFRKNGYIFLGWSENKLSPAINFDESKIQYKNGSEVQIFADLKLYAVWLETWAADGYMASWVQDEEGTYLISSAAQLARLTLGVSAVPSGLKFKLVNNIDLSGKYWRTSTGIFYESFDGNGYTISNLKTFDKAKELNLEGSEFGGFMLSLNNGAVIKNVKFENCETVDSVIARSVNKSTIENCTISSGIVRSSGSSSDDTASIAASLNEGTIKNCVNYALIDNGGGIAGWVRENSSVENCINYGDITNLDKSANMSSGGIATFMSRSLIENCINYGNITYQTDGRPNSQAYIAGIVAQSSNSTIDSCANFGNLTSGNVNYRIGGIAYSSKNDAISNCSSHCSRSELGVSEPSHHMLVSINESVILSSYAFIEVEGDAIYKQIYGLPASFAESFRIKEGVNGNLPMQTGLFHIASQIGQQSNQLFINFFEGYEVI